MSSYCTAFAYRPVVENTSDKMAGVYLEVPEDISIFQNPTTSRSVEACILVFSRKPKYVISVQYSTV